MLALLTWSMLWDPRSTWRCHPALTSCCGRLGGRGGASGQLDRAQGRPSPARNQFLMSNTTCGRHMLELWLMSVRVVNFHPSDRALVLLALCHPQEAGSRNGFRPRLGSVPGFPQVHPEALRPQCVPATCTVTAVVLMHVCSLSLCLCGFSCTLGMPSCINYGASLVRTHPLPLIFRGPSRELQLISINSSRSYHCSSSSRSHIPSSSIPVPLSAATAFTAATAAA